MGYLFCFKKYLIDRQSICKIIARFVQLYVKLTYIPLDRDRRSDNNTLLFSILCTIIRYEAILIIIAQFMQLCMKLAYGPLDYIEIENQRINNDMLREMRLPRHILSNEDNH